ncbi:copper chaperone PCu(A)C [Phenylobacterium sp.]|uniref:copper chaperone PCu(A)C n=1 Tax=Phenylobacterium sp. TaxID=1871053 RepID=UPI0025EC94DE|nr:copper chaperone PCu(A)C [Phenylobacterium sp.]
MRSLPIAAVVSMGLASAAHAAPQVQAAWSRPAAQGTTGAGFMTLANPGPKPDALVAVASPLAGQVMIHQSAMAGGVASMKMVAQVPLPPGGHVTFAPGGYHVMFVGLTRALKLGDTLPATLTFASGARVKASFVVGLTPPVAPVPKP